MSLLCNLNIEPIAADADFCLWLFTQNPANARWVAGVVNKRFDVHVIAHADGVEVVEGVGISKRWWIQADVCAEILSSVAPNAAAVRSGPLAGVHPRVHE